MRTHLQSRINNRKQLQGYLLPTSALLQAFALILAGLILAGQPLQAANILINPGFEADGGHSLNSSAAGWSITPGYGGQAYINQDAYAHAGNNYYKVWGQFNGAPNTTLLWQDKSSLATSAYQADGWLFALDSDSIWSGDGANLAWNQVSFLDAGGNVLALYRSDLFNPTQGQIPYATSTWYDLPVTNICQPDNYLNVTGSTNLLVAPPGTVTVRYAVGYYQLLYGGGSCYFDDEALNQISGPVPPVISNVYPGSMLLASNHISFAVSSPSSTPISASGIHLVVNGTDVSSSPDLAITGSGSSYNVLYTGLSTNVWSYAATITVTDTLGLSDSTSMSFDTINPAYLWEAEDYDFTNGMYYDSPLVSSTPQANCYAQVTGSLGVDYYSTATGQAHYRTNDTSGTGLAGDGVRQKFITAQLTDPNAVDYVVGYIAVNDWFNYTRDIAPGTYNIYARLSGGSGATTVSFDDVTSGSPNNLGVFTFNGNNWGAYNYIPLLDGNGNLLQFTLGGKTTFRATLTSGGDNMNFFMLVPAQPSAPVISNVAPTNNALFATETALSFTATSPLGINNSGVKLWLNGADVSSGLVFSGPNTSLNVSYPLLKPNTIYTAVFTVTNTVGSGVSRTVQFDTMSQNNFYVACDDFDFSGGQYDTSGNGLVQDGYIGNASAISGVDFNHNTTAGEQFNYRSGLATQVTTDFVLPGFLPNYNIGWFGYGDWGNYTRNYPAGKYLIYGRMAGFVQSDTLDQVTSGVGTTTQTLKRLGTFNCNPNGWGTWIWVPLTDAASAAPVVVTLGGVETLRFSSGNNCNANYLMLVPVSGITMTATLSGSNVNLSFPTVAGSSYNVYYATSLTASTWTLLKSAGGTGSTVTVADSLNNGVRFYKVVSQ